MNKTPVYLMHAYVGGKVIIKDCFVRLDVTEVAPALETTPKEVENATENVEVEAEVKQIPEMNIQSQIEVEEET
ncbi:hypothetical protein [Priestia flexa]|uniref:hypothetical protein n=1 Tax=Priestia flexa TaxID=86664 RepID=UPI0032EDF8E0